MTKLSAGFMIGLAAALVAGVFFQLQQGLELAPDMQPIALMSDRLQALPVTAWSLHLAVGALWGVAFARVAQHVPLGPCWLRGVAFGFALFGLVGMTVLPLAGYGFFAAGLGGAAPIVGLALHAVFGAVLGLLYAEVRPFYRDAIEAA